jgi:monoamine oxidase
MGPWGKRVAAVEALLSGRPLAEVSVHDWPTLDYADNLFIAGGLGAYLARLSRAVPVSLGTPVRALDWSGARLSVETDAGSLAARAAIVTVPMAVLQREAIRFTPPLPDALREAIAGFRPGVYEHVVLHWPGAPFRGPDRLATLIGHRPVPGMLTRIDGTPFHYVELDHAAAAALDGAGPGAASRYARAALAEHFGAAALRGLSVMAATAWRHDPCSLGSWAVVPPGHAAARDVLKAPVADRLWFAGEALSRGQWGTAGGAWQEGERAAEAVVARLAR